MRNLLLVLCLLAATTTPASADERAERRAALREQLSARREQNLKRFHAYRKARIYPHNSYEEGALNVWRDAEGHLCAVATLVAKDGFDDLIAQTAERDNFIKLAEVTSGPLADWMLTSGFTHEELVMIQWPSYHEDMRRARQERRKEDRRLARGYLETERALRMPRAAEAGLDLAVARLEARPDLAAAFLARP